MTRPSWRRTRRPKLSQRRTYSERRTIARRRIARSRLPELEGTWSL